MAAAKKKPDVSGKAAIKAEVKYQLQVKGKQRQRYDEFDVGTWASAELIVEQVGDDIMVRPEDCETQIKLTLPTLRAMMVELEKKIEVK